MGVGFVVYLLGVIVLKIIFFVIGVLVKVVLEGVDVLYFIV